VANDVDQALERRRRQGYATPLVVGDRLYVFTRQGENEVMTAFDAGSAKAIWRTSYPAPFKMNPATAPHGPGPKSTPTSAANRLFTLGISGIVTAFDATTGKQIWQRQPDPVEPLYHTAMSPLVVGNQMILHVGGHDKGALTSFDVATGKGRATSLISRPHVPEVEITSIEDYRIRYALYKSDPSLQAVHAAFPWIMTWDDHETENDYAGFAPENPNDPADNQPDFASRRAAPTRRITSTCRCVQRSSRAVPTCSFIAT
jgi:hypothetical protein